MTGCGDTDKVVYKMCYVSGYHTCGHPPTPVEGAGAASQKSRELRSIALSYPISLQDYVVAEDVETRLSGCGT
jgi:hypothetical protein